MRVFSRIVVVIAVLALVGAGWVAASGEDSKPAKPAAEKADGKADPKCDPKAVEKAKAAGAKTKDGKKEKGAPVCKPADSKESFFTLEDIYAGKLEAAETEKSDEDDAVTWRKVDDKKKKDR